MPTDIGGEQAARALFALLELIARHSPHGWRRPGRDADTRLISIGAPLAMFNGVFRNGREPDPADLEAYAQQADDLPWSVFSAAEPSPGLRAAAAAAGLTGEHRAPVLTRPAGPVPPTPDGVVVRAVGPGDRKPYVDLLAAGFEAPREIFDALMTESLMGAPGVTSYLIEAHGEPVATGFGVLAEGLVGIFNVATPPAFRRRGYGRVATEAALREGFAAGATGAYLLPSEMGLPLYRAMGFRPTATWTFLVSE